jgi:nucleotide-binding universal stress UspA family protein
MQLDQRKRGTTMTTFSKPAAEPTYRTVLVPLDGSAFAVGALATARALAGRFGATIHTISVTSSDGDLHERRAEAARALGTEPGDPRVHVAIGTDVGRAVEQCASELDPCLVCLATHGRGRLSGVVLGSTGRDIVERVATPTVVTGPEVVFVDPEDDNVPPPLAADHLVACIDGTPRSELGVPVAAAWAHALGMSLTLVTVAEPCPPPVRIGDPWRRRHGPDEDADGYVRRVAERWAVELPGLETSVVYDPISPGDGMKDYLSSHPAGLVAVTSRLRDPLGRLVHGSGAAGIVQSSTAPVLVIPSTVVEV